jgi:hypothetical protein
MTRAEQPQSERDLIVQRAILLQLRHVHPDSPTRGELSESLRDKYTGREDVSRALDGLHRDGIVSVAADGSAVRISAVALATIRLLDGC